MATAIPESFTYSLLSRLPPNSFVSKWVEVRPDQAPAPKTNGTGPYYQLMGAGANSGERVRFHLRGAPNEFLLNTNCYVSGSARLNVSQVHQAAPVVGPPAANQIFSDYGAAYYASLGLVGALKSPIDFFDSSRESFNSGALPILDNQDNTFSHVINHLRSRLARRNDRNNGAYLDDLFGGFSSYPSQNVEPSFNREQGRVPSVESSLKLTKGVCFYYVNAIAPGPPATASFRRSSFGDRKFQIPLGYFSSLINSHSVLPLGLFSSYSVNGYSIELQTTRSLNNNGTISWAGNAATDGLLTVPYRLDNTPLVPETSITLTNPSIRMSDLSIWMQVIEILDPAVMESILGLYEKREMVNLGGMQFPLSLRLNSLNYRFSNYSLGSNSDYHFRIPGTDKSVRALAFWVYQQSRLNEGDTSLQPAVRNIIRLTRLKTKIGSETIHEVVEDRDSSTNRVDNFLNVNMRKSGSLFSPLPQYNEGTFLQNGQQEDAFHNMNCGGLGAVANTVSPPFPENIGAISYFYNLYGVISLENLDRREGDHPGSYQASGKNLNNIGGIEVDMRFQALDDLPAIGGVPQGGSVNGLDTANANTAFGAQLPTGFGIQFAYVYDQVTELSPSGVMDISDAVL